MGGRVGGAHFKAHILYMFNGGEWRLSGGRRWTGHVARSGVKKDKMSGWLVVCLLGEGFQTTWARWFSWSQLKWKPV